jgi:hypothetical protein
VGRVSNPGNPKILRILLQTKEKLKILDIIMFCFAVGGWGKGGWMWILIVDYCLRQQSC